MAIQRTMSFSDWVNEYKPIEFNSIDNWFDNYNDWFDDYNVVDSSKKQFIKKAKDLIGKYLIKYPEIAVYPHDHTSVVYIERPPADIPDGIPDSFFFWYVVTRKPMANINEIIIKEELDGRKITLNNNPDL